MEKEAYEESISYLFQLAKFFPASDDDLNRCRASRKIILKEFLGYFCELNKYDAWTRGDVTIFHVTGTKGKGSVCHFLNSTLSQLEPTGLFISPHLHCIRERISISNELISKSELIEGVSAIKKFEEEKMANAQFPDFILFFDKLFLLGLWYFTIKQPKIVIFEVGMGGYYDTTNLYPTKHFKNYYSIITSISFDHQAILGDSIHKITLQKAGIVKKNRVLFTSSFVPQFVLEILANVAYAKHCRFFTCDFHFLIDYQASQPHWQPEPRFLTPSGANSMQDFFQTHDTQPASPKDLECGAHFRTDEDYVRVLQERLQQRWDSAEFQTHNFGLAYQALMYHIDTVLYQSTSPKRIPSGFGQNQQGHWEELNERILSAMQILQNAARFEYFSGMKNNFSVLVDGAHNVESLHLLYQSVSKRFLGKKIVTLFGCGSENWRKMLPIVTTSSDRYYLLQASHSRATPAADLINFLNSTDLIPESDKSKRQSINSIYVYDVIAHLSSVQSDADTVYVVTGSLFIAAEARVSLYQQNLFNFPLSDTVSLHDSHLTYVNKYK